MLNINPKPKPNNANTQQLEIAKFHAVAHADTLLPVAFALLLASASQFGSSY
jgi:hypothetical protein